jgi:D-beta-D-heptose 7-phosphate kinase/D-beta-D-heptose 1-phosphate adenosyltransferase
MRVIVVGLVGRDQDSLNLRDALDRASVEHVLCGDTRPTSVKTRYTVSRQQLLRVDREEPPPVDEVVRQRLASVLHDEISDRQPDVVVVSDYAKGALGPEMLAEIRACAESRPVVVDPRGRDWYQYGPVRVIKPNVRELGIMVGQDLDVCNLSLVQEAAECALRKCNALSIMVTMGHRGILVSCRDGDYVVSSFFPAREVEVYDVTGAGDAVNAVVSAVLSLGLGLPEAAHVANAAASQIVQQRGVGRIDVDLLKERL